MWRAILISMLVVPALLLAFFHFTNRNLDLWAMLAFGMVCAGIYHNRLERLARIRAQSGRGRTTNSALNFSFIVSLAVGGTCGFAYGLKWWAILTALGCFMVWLLASIFSEFADEKAGVYPAVGKSIP